MMIRASLTLSSYLSGYRGSQLRIADGTRQQMAIAVKLFVVQACHQKTQEDVFEGDDSMIASLSDVVEAFDDEGAVDGYQFGRAVRLQEWRERKEEAEYRAIYDRLYKRNSARRARAAGGKRLARIQQQQKSYRVRHRAELRAREWQRRKAQYEANPVINTCEECGKSWSPPYEQEVKRSRFCCRQCRNRFHGRERTSSGRRRKGLRMMNIKTATIDALTERPWLTCSELATATGAKKRSLAVCLKRWCDHGLLTRRGRPREYRYSIYREQ